MILINTNEDDKLRTPPSLPPSLPSCTNSTLVFLGKTGCNLNCGPTLARSTGSGSGTSLPPSLPPSLPSALPPYLHKLHIGLLGKARVQLKLRPHLSQVHGVEERDEDDGVGVTHRDGGDLREGGREGGREGEVYM